MNREKRNDAQHLTNGSGGPLLAGLMIGGLVGAGTMLLLAPQSGRRTRREIEQGAIDLRDRTSESVKGAVADARSRAGQLVGSVRDTADRLQNQGKEIAIEQLDRVSSAAQAHKKQIQAAKDDSLS